MLREVREAALAFGTEFRRKSSAPWRPHGGGGGGGERRSEANLRFRFYHIKEPFL